MPLKLLLLPENLRFSASLPKKIGKWIGAGMYHNALFYQSYYRNKNIRRVEIETWAVHVTHFVTFWSSFNSKRPGNYGFSTSMV